MFLAVPAMLRPYHATLALEEHFRSKFEKSEFYELVSMFQLLFEEDEQRETLRLFKTLTKVIVLQRAKNIMRLDRLASEIHNRKYVIQSS